MNAALRTAQILLSKTSTVCLGGATYVSPCAALACLAKIRRGEQ